MKKFLIFSLLLVMWGGYKFTIPAEDLLTKKIVRIDQIVEVIVFLVVLFIICLNVAKRILLHKALFPKLLLQGFSTYLLFFYMIALASSIVSYYPSYSFFRAAQYLITIFLIGYILEEITNYGVIVKTIFYFSLINLIYVIIGFFLFPQIVEGAEIGRLTGGGLFKVDQGVVPFTVCILSLCYYFTSKQHLWKIMAGGIFFLAFLVLLLYQTRNVVYQIPFYFLFIIYCYRKMSFKAFLIIFLFAAILFVSAHLGLSAIELFRHRGFIIESRLATWEIIIQNLDQIPLWGFGFLGTPAFLLPKKEILHRSMVHITADPHNYFLSAYTDLGIIGFCYTIIFVILLLQLIIKRFKITKLIPQNFIIPGIISIIIQGVVSSFFTNYLIAPINFNTVAAITCILILDKAGSFTERVGCSIYGYKR